MSSNEEVLGERRKKRDLLVAAGMNPYAAKTNVTHTVENVITNVEAFIRDKTPITVAGRVMAVRVHGGSAFADVFDGTGKLQLFFSKDTVGEGMFDLFVNAIDLGDFIEARGVMFVTKRETHALQVASWTVLTKALESIPSEHFGIKDEDERYRKRYLDILLDGELRDLFLKKAKFWDVSRNFMKEHGFLEVETPTLESMLGAKGAGEAGTAGAPAAIMNAINDALTPFRAKVFAQPFTPERILAALGKVPMR